MSSSIVRVWVVEASNWLVLIGLIAGCATAPVRAVEEPEPDPERSGAATFVDFQPKNSPTLLGNYDFELLEQVQGTRCLRRNELDVATYWMMLSGLEKVSPDALTRQVVAAAAHDALSHLEDADTIVVTRVVATGSTANKVCATVFGRAVRLIKSESTTSE